MNRGVGRVGPGRGRAGPGRHRRLSRVHHLVPGRVSPDALGSPATIAPTLPPGTAVALAVLLAGGLWLALRPPPWLLPDRPARRFGIAMAVAMVAGFVLTSRLGGRCSLTSYRCSAR
jgi:hypothetical protein